DFESVCPVKHKTASNGHSTYLEKVLSSRTKRVDEVLGGLCCISSVDQARGRSRFYQQQFPTETSSDN
ncbi:Hypothetical predicted protein, partial [Pelobates cultripes]